MIAYNKATPVLLPVFGSLETTRRIFAELQRIEPLRLYLFFNVPVNEEQASVQEEIKSVFSRIKWKCRVKILYNKTPLEDATEIENDHRTIFNKPMLKAVRWFFRQEPEGIVLEGLSVPFPAFFAFCSCLLEKYRHDERIGHISGWDFRKPNQKSKTNDSYYFSKLAHVSPGWASWRRVWQDLNVQLKTFTSFKKLNIIEEMPSHKPFRFQWHFLNHFETHWEARIEYVNLINNRLSVVPDTRRIPVSEYEFAEMNHPVFMFHPVAEELRLQESKYYIPAITSNQPDGLSFLYEKLLSFNEAAGKRMKIPRIIHQIYEDPAGPPANLLRIAETWKENHPGWEYRFWNKQMMHDFLESLCADFLPYYRSYRFNVQRWDAIRYLILYHIGGLYVDFDYECLRPLDVLLTGASCCMGMEPTVNGKFFNKPLVVGNALMASVPKHPYMAAIINDMKTRFSVDYGVKDSIQVVESTGPFMVTRVYEQFKRKKEVTLLPADLVAPLTMREVAMLRTVHSQPDLLKKVEKAFAIHYFFGSWTPQVAKSKDSQKMQSK